MKAGTLYDMLRQFLPNITTRMFTEFYNQGMSKVTRDARVSVVETQFDGDTEFGYIGSEAVFIDFVYHDSVKLFYSIENGVLKVRDYTGQEYDKLNGLIVRYHKFFDEAILEEPVEITRNVFNNSGKWAYIPGQGVICEDGETGKIRIILIESSRPPFVLGEVIDATINDGGEYIVLSRDGVSIPATGDNAFSFLWLPSTWAWQDDGLPSSAQIAATYWAGMMLTDISGGSMEVGKYMREKFDYYLKEIKRKYNSSPSARIVGVDK